jgi:tetratricopeptide (TPR) repeat protein
VVIDVEEDWEARLAALWAALDELPEGEFLARMAAVTGELGDDSAVAAFERGGAFDSTGHPDEAVPLYRRALALGLTGIRRRRAVIQLSSSLRNLGELPEALALLQAERQRGSDELDDAVVACLALVLADFGREREALSLTLGALAPHLSRYQRSMGNYARALVDEPPRG